MTTTVVTLSADEAQLLRAFQAIQAQQAKTDKGFNTMATDARAASGQISGDMVAAGTKTTESFNAALKELRKMGPEGRAAAAEVEKHLRESGQAGRVSFEAVVAELGKMDAKSAEIAQNASKTFKEAADSADKAFGQQAVAKVKDFVVAWASVGTAIAGVKSLLAEMRKEQTAALDSLMAQADPDRRLAQVATSSEDLDQMLNKADQIAVDTGMSRAQAKDLVFSARSEGFEADLDTIARANQVIDSKSQAKLAGTLRVAFKDEGLDTEQNLSSVLTAAGESKFDFETVGRAVEKSATTSTNAGADMAETLAVNAMLANSLGESAGDRTKAFASKVTMTPELRGKGLIGAVEAIQGMSDEDRTKTLGGSMEVNEAYSAMEKELAAIKAMAEKVRADQLATAGGAGTLNAKLAITERSQRFQARQAVSGAEVRKEIALERVDSAEEAAFQAGINNYRADRIEAGGNRMAGIAGGMAGEAARAAGMGADQAVTAARGGEGFFEGAVGALTGGLLGGGGPGLMSGRPATPPESVTVPTPVVPGNNSRRGGAAQARANAAAADAAAIGKLTASVDEQNRLVAQGNALLAQTAANTAPRSSPVPPITGAALQAPVTAAAAP